MRDYTLYKLLSRVKLYVFYTNYPQQHRVRPSNHCCEIVNNIAQDYTPRGHGCGKLKHINSL
jgi:hypothetical protein